MQVAEPVVSCITPTRDRRAFVPLAIECFLRQDYDARELVIVDDGADPVADLAGVDPRIRYERLDDPAMLGKKRNIACKLARGEVIAHWDDDDWSAPNRLSAQVEALTQGDADLVGLDELYFFDPASGKAWLYGYPQRTSRPWVAGGTLCYRRSFWEQHPFPAIKVGEDTRFVWAHRARVTAVGDKSLYVATVHSGNTSAKRPRAPRWSKVARAEVSKVLGADEAVIRAAVAGDTAAKHAVEAKSSPLSKERAPVEPHAVVAVSYYRCREHIRQCVDGILAQTHRNLTLVVVNDGDPVPPWDLLADIDDPRLIRFDLPRNRGRYFADEVVLRATASEYLFVHDADDWSEPHRIATLLRSLRAEHAVGAVSAASRRGSANARPRLVGVSRVTQPLGKRFRHLANHHGLFRTDALRAVGGFYAGFTIGYDTFLVNALAMTGRIAAVSEPLYHWRVRPGSLTSAKETGLKSELRSKTTRQLEEMYRRAYESYCSYLNGALDLDGLAATIRSLGTARVAKRLEAELAEQSRALAGVLAGAAGAQPPTAPPRRLIRAAPRRPRPARRQRQRPRRVPITDVYGLQDHPGLRWDAWTVSRTLAVELAERLERRRPLRILEAGSGNSTAVLAQFAARSSARVVTLEHDAAYAARTRRLLASLGLDGIVDLRLSRLRPFVCADGRRRAWYDAALEGPFDFVLVDGPPLKSGRAAALFAVHPLLADDWELWLDDARREHEQECLRIWHQRLALCSVVHDLDEKGLAVLGPADRPSPEVTVAPKGLAIGVLTGGRPDLLERTLGSLAALAPQAVTQAHVLVFVNGRDGETEAHVRSLPFVDRVVLEPNRLSVGRATSRLMTELAATRGVNVVLHLEDDWAACTLADGWLERGMRILGTDRRVGQVRLRHRSDRVLRRHMITRHPVSWKADGDILRARAAHFTFNPSLIRSAEVARFFPVADETAAQRRFLRAGLATVQLSPGVFRHIGAGRSLRAG
jgi:glycosyltransferase involved in cell wall biosynthesis/predicted O-methyltransferase YrrM